MRVSRVLTFARYEIRRAVARKKVLALVALTILIRALVNARRRRYRFAGL